MLVGLQAGPVLCPQCTVVMSTGQRFRSPYGECRHMAEERKKRAYARDQKRYEPLRREMSMSRSRSIESLLRKAGKL